MVFHPQVAFFDCHARTDEATETSTLASTPSTSSSLPPPPCGEEGREESIHCDLLLCGDFILRRARYCSSLASSTPADFLSARVVHATE